MTARRAAKNPSVFATNSVTSSTAFRFVNLEAGGTPL
jgi:hypothetical protein